MMFRNLDCARILCTRGLYHASRKVLNPDPFNTLSSACTGVQSFKSANDPLEYCPVTGCNSATTVHHSHHELTISYTLLPRERHDLTGIRRQTRSSFPFCHHGILPSCLRVNVPNLLSSRAGQESR